MTPIEELTAIARFAGVQHVLDIAREMLPASDYDELVSRLRQNRRSAAVPAVGFSGPAVVEARANEPSQDGAA